MGFIRAEVRAPDLLISKANLRAGVRVFFVVALPSPLALVWRERERAKREDFAPWKLVLAASFARVQMDGKSAAALANPPFRQFLHEVASKCVMYFSAPLHAGKRFHQAQPGQGFGGCSRVMTSTRVKEPTHR